MGKAPQDEIWQCHGWDDHLTGQLEHGRSLTFREKLEWLEEMSAFVDRLRQNPEWRARNAAIMGAEARPPAWAVNEPPPPQT